MKQIQLITIIFLLMSIGIIAQIPDNYNITSPQVSDFIRYGNVPVSHYTGNLDFKVNLLEELQDVEEVIPINLVYNSSGFIPNKLNDFVGHNWFLQYGGVVTREVNGRPDDYYDPDTNIHQQGFIFARYLSNSTIYEKKDYKKYGSYNYVFNDGRQNVELLPDKFKFNINGISGSFYLGNSNQPVVSSNTNTNLKVDASRFNIQNKQQDVIPVSYTHLDVYKRQALIALTNNYKDRQTTDKKALRWRNWR